MRHFSNRKKLDVAAKSSGLGARIRDGWNWKEIDHSFKLLSTVLDTQK